MYSTHQDMRLMLTAVTQQRNLVAGQDLAVQRHLPHAPTDGMVRLWVRDNGLGLASENQARLFIPFTRLNQARVKGQGLGLSIVRRIVEKLGGRVGVESQIGRGSSFFFTLPGAVSPTTPITDKADRLFNAAKMTEGGIQALDEQL